MKLTALLDKFNKLELKAKYGIFAAVLLIILAIDGLTVLNFQWGALQQMARDNQGLQDNIAQINADRQRMAQMKAGLAKSTQQLAWMNHKIRFTGEISSILEDISQIANQVGLKIDELHPQAEVMETLKTTGNIKYYSLPIVVQASSGYHIFGRFLNQLESSNLFIQLSHLSIDAQASDSTKHQIHATFKVVLSDTKTEGMAPIGFVMPEGLKPFVYEDQGKKDPLAPLVSSSGVLISYDANTEAADMILEGVVLDAQGNNFAIINSKIVKKGDYVGDYLVEEINQDHVALIKGQEQMVIKLRKVEL